MTKNPQEQAAQELQQKLNRLPAFHPADMDTWGLIRETMEAADQPADQIERWGRLMQAEIAAGQTISEIAEPTATEVNYGTMPDIAFIGFTVPILHQVWNDREQADELMRWYAAFVNNL